jgi:hypothetical protein
MNASCGLSLAENSLPSESIYESGRVQIYYPSVYRLLQQDNSRSSEYGFTTMSDVDVNAGTTTTRVLTLSPRKARSVGDPSLTGKRGGGHVYDVPQRLLPINARTKQIQQQHHHDQGNESTATVDHHHHSCPSSSLNSGGKASNMSSTFTGTSIRPPSFRSLYDQDTNSAQNNHPHSRMVHPSDIQDSFTSHLQHDDDNQRVDE